MIATDSHPKIILWQGYLGASKLFFLGFKLKGINYNSYHLVLNQCFCYNTSIIIYVTLGHHPLSCKRSVGCSPCHCQLNNVSERALETAGIPLVLEPLISTEAMAKGQME